MQTVDPRRPNRQDTFDLRDQIHHSDIHSHAEAANHGLGVANNAYISDEEEHSVLEDDSDDPDGGHGDGGEYDDDDDGSSSLSIPNESIDFDLVYSLHSFAATVEGQANVVKGDSLFLMDDSNSYWWLVRVLKTQEVGYIPAENIETPFERLARLNKHRNVDLAAPTQNDHILREKKSTKSVTLTGSLSVHRYPPAVWDEEEEQDEDVEWDEGDYMMEDASYGEEEDDAEQRIRQRHAIEMEMEPDDGMQWDNRAAEANQQAQLRAQQEEAQRQQAEQEERERLARQQQQQQQQQALVQQQQALVQQQRQQQLAQQQQQSKAQTRQSPSPQQQQQQAQQERNLRSPSSRERLNATPDANRAVSPANTRLDPAQVTETRKLSATPTIAREEALSRAAEEDRKRVREEEIAAAEEARKKTKANGNTKHQMGAPVSSAPLTKSGGGKLRKDRDAASPIASTSEDEGGKKKNGVFGRLFKKKEKKGSASIGSVESADALMRPSEESKAGSIESGVMSPTTATALQQQQQQSMARSVTSIDSARPSQDSSLNPEVSSHASQLRQRDQEQQQLYMQYLTRSPSSPPEAQASANFGLRTASSVMAEAQRYQGPPGAGNNLNVPASSPPGSVTSKPRPGSLLISPGAMEGPVPELSVIRIFAGKGVQTEATFKTVLLNASTTSSDLILQSIQRFRLPAGEDPQDYYLTVKQVEGSSAVLRANENPLIVFEGLVEAAMELPRVKRSSMGSISSVSSNLSMHPAIKKLSMNDFTDDSAVKFYLNRKGSDPDDSFGQEHEDTLIADSSMTTDPDLSTGSSQFLSVSASGSSNVAERFQSPSSRFPMQLLIYPEDLPDDMIFDPLTEAIVFKHTLRERDSGMSSGTMSPQAGFRRKVFVFPKNITVAEVIEIGLERFGIQEGVVDGGDEVEDKNLKRRSHTRVRYGLFVSLSESTERELSPASRLIEAFPRQPNFKAPPRNEKRRSIDSTMLLGSIEDVAPDDPVFILRRATSYRNSTSRHRNSAPLDEIALQKLHRESASSATDSEPLSPRDDSFSSMRSTSSRTRGPQQQPTRQEIIAAQRAAKRANQQSILSTQVNSSRGVDVLLSGNGMLRSTRHDSADKMRYSYVEPDGETYDISDIVEEEWRGSNPDARRQDDLLRGVLKGDGARPDGSGGSGVGEKLERVLNKINKGGRMIPPALQPPSSRDDLTDLSASPASEYSMQDSASSEKPNELTRSRSTTPVSAGIQSRTPIPQQQAQSIAPSSRATSPYSYNTARTSSPAGISDVLSNGSHGRPGTTTPTAASSRNIGSVLGKMGRNPSLASVGTSGYATPATHASPVNGDDLDDSPTQGRPPANVLTRGSPTSINTTTAAGRGKPQGGVYVPRDDFGIREMMAVIEQGARERKRKELGLPPGAVVPRNNKLPPLDPVDELLFGRPFDPQSLHPQIREVYQDGFKLLDEADKDLDKWLAQSLKA